MDDGWFWRDLIIWDKGPLGPQRIQPISRCRHNFEYVLFFTAQRIRILVRPGRAPHPAGWRTALQCQQRILALLGRNKPGVLRKDGDRDFRVASIHWVASPTPCGISHRVDGMAATSASFPEEFVRRALLLTAPPREMPPLATVIDFYGGSGTVSAVAKQLGLKINLHRLEPDLYGGGPAASADNRARSW